MTLSLTFEIRLDSDYHIGGGGYAGPLVDSPLLRDYDNAPLLRGTALVGLLRDGLYDLLDLFPVNKLKDWVIGESGAEIRLFGSPKQAKRWAYSSARPTGAIGETKVRWGSQDITRVRINPRTRRADAQQLFSQEEGDARLVFHFRVTCYGATEQDVADAALLVAAARMVRHLGSARRRGRGECRLTLIEAEGFSEPTEGESWLDHALNEFKTRWLDATESPAKGEPVVEPEPALSVVEGSPSRFRIIARAYEPILIARRSEAANTYESLSTIPGTALLGALATRAAQMLGLGIDDQTPEEFVTLFMRGGIRTTGLLPAVEGSSLRPPLYPAIPAPPSLFTCEIHPDYQETGQGHGIHDALFGQISSECPTCGAKLKPLKNFLILQSDPVSYEPKRREEMHIRMSRDTGRVKSGDLYEYIALEAGQWFVGELDCANQACWERLQKLTRLNENQTYELRLGKASRRGYGLIRMILQPLGENDPSPFILQSLDQRINDPKDLRIMLLSDAIVSDPWGRFYTGFDSQWLAEELGVCSNHITIQREFVNTRSIDSFNTHRRLPRWRDEAVVAGSIARLQLADDALTKLVETWHKQGETKSANVTDELAALRWKLKQIEKVGVGLRKHEGFGRVAFNHPISMPNYNFDGKIRLNRLPSGLRPRSGNHILEVEANFGTLWEPELNQSQQNDERWQHITAAYLPLARLLFLSRPIPPQQAQQWLSVNQPTYLWGKQIKHRDKQGSIKGDGLKLIEGLVEKLREIADTDQKWCIGMTRLAERIALAAEENEKRKKSK